MWTSMAIRSSMGMWQCSCMCCCRCEQLKLLFYNFQYHHLKQYSHNTILQSFMQTQDSIQLRIIIYIMGRQENTQQVVEAVPKPSQPNSSELSMRNSPLLLRIHADDQNKKTICIFWTVLFAIAILIAIISAFALPAILVKNNMLQSQAGTSLATWTKVTCQSSTLQFGDLVVGWGPANQFGFLFLEIRPSDLSQTISISQDYLLQLYDLKKEQDSGGVFFSKVGNPQQLSATLSFTSSKNNALYGQDKKTIVGYEQLLAILTRFDDNPFLSVVKFNQNLNLPNSTTVNLQSYAINPKFTYYTIILRYVYFSFAIVGCALYLIRFLLIPREKKIIEQKMIAVASVLLIMFNDPFYIITVLKPNAGSAFFSLLFIVNMIAFLMLLWLVFADRICFEDGEIETLQLTKKKIAYVALVWALLIICLMIFTMQQIDHAPIVPNSFASRYKAAQVIIGLVVFAGIAYIAYRFVRSCMAEEGKTWRSYLFMVFSSVFIFAVFIIIVSNSLILYNYSGPVILIIYTLINIYVYYLQYMFTITREEADKLKNPIPEAEHNYDVITVGTIELVDVNLDEDEEKIGENGPKPKKEEREQVRESDKNEFESQDFQ